MAVKLVALHRIKDVKGAVVPEMVNRKGRRVISQLPYQPGCADSMRQREIKWEELEAEAMAKATSSSSSTE